MTRIPPTLNLNHLPIFLAVIDHQSVAAAAGQLGVSEGTVRHAIASLRLHFADRLFIFSARGTVATPLACELGRRIRASLSLLDFG